MGEFSGFNIPAYQVRVGTEPQVAIMILIKVSNIIVKQEIFTGFKRVNRKIKPIILIEPVALSQTT